VGTSKPVGYDTFPWASAAQVRVQLGDGVGGQGQGRADDVLA